MYLSTPVEIATCPDARAADLVSVAAALRRFSSQEEPSFSTRKIIADCFPEILVTGRRLPCGVDEIVSVRDHGPVIVYSRSISGPEQRFAIAHALAHLLFGDVQGARVGAAGVAWREARADQFAAELLAPLVELEPYVCRWPSADDPEEHEIYLDMVDEIASHFVVPSYVIDKQIRLMEPVHEKVHRFRLTNR